MKKLLFYLTPVFILSSCDVASDEHQELTGKKFHYRYNSGLETSGFFENENTLKWETLSGPAKGMTGTEFIYVEKVSAGIFFVSWLETSGTTISQVLDLNKKTVTGFVTYEADGKRQPLFDKGSLAEI